MATSLASDATVQESRRADFLFVEPSGATLEGLGKMIEKGQVRPIVEHTYTWDELGEAHRRVETKRVAGKVAVVPPS